MLATLPEATELLRLSRLIHEVCEMGHDAYAWRSHLCSVVMPMIDADFGTAYVMKHPIDPAHIGPRTPLMMTVFVSECFERYVEEGDLTDQPITPGMMARMGTDFTVTRQELIDDETWYRSPFVARIAQPSGWDQLLCSQVAINPPGYISGLGFARHLGKPAMTQHEVDIVHFVHMELGRLWRRPDPLDLHNLPDRQREVVDGIRRGETRKAIAEKMGVSDNTVHTYEKALFERAGVGGRGELLASISKVIRPNLLP